MSDITEFLLARIAEDEHRANVEAVLRDGDPYYDGELNSYDRRFDPARVLAECAAKRAIIKFHEDWPVLVDQPPAVEISGSNTESLVYRASRQIIWGIEREYIARFGTEPPTAPMLRALAAVYAGHEDYRQEWAV